MHAYMHPFYFPLSCSHGFSPITGPDPRGGLPVRGISAAERPKRRAFATAAETDAWKAIVEPKEGDSFFFLKKKCKLANDVV